MMLRRQLPTHSEMSAAALAAGLAGALGRDFAHEIVQEIQRTWSARAVLLADSGTSALSLAIKTAIGDSGRVVALPAYACYDLVTAAVGANARVVFYDIDPHTLAPDLDSLHRALALQPAAVVVVHLYGVPLPILQLQEMASAAHAMLIEDAAQAVGTTLGGRPAGSYGSLGVLSFGRGKGLTGGGGGALLANDGAGVALLQQASLLLSRVAPAGWGTLAKTALQWLLARPAVYGVPAALPFLRLGETIYHAPHAPTRMPRAAIGALLRVWRDAHDAANVRRRNAHRLLMAARRTTGWQNIETGVPDAQPGFLRLPLLVPSSRAQLLTGSAARLGVIQGYPLPLNRLPAATTICANAEERCPGAQRLADELLTLPTHRLLSESDLVELEAWLQANGTTTRSPAVREQHATV